MNKFLDTLVTMLIALVIVGMLVGPLVWIGHCETCRIAGYSGAAIIERRVYCVRVVDGRVEGWPVKDVIERMSGVADWE